VVSKKSLSVVSALLACALATGWSGAVASSSGVHSGSSKVVARVPAKDLVLAGHLTICSDIPYAPKEFYNAKGQLVGSDVDMGNDIAARLGLKPNWVNSVFDTIIEALESGKCDVIISAMGVTPARSKQIKQIAYDASGQTFVVLKGNPSHIGDVTKNPLFLCGHTVSVELGTMEQDELKSYVAKCSKAHKPSIPILSTAKADTSIEQLLTRKAQVLFQDEAPNAYLVLQRPDQFQILGKSVFKGPEGIGVVKTNTALINAVIKVVRGMWRDGTLRKILVKWHMASDTLPVMPS
jgi:polar amino acid transport system substrate-binding protein